MKNEKLAKPQVKEKKKILSSQNRTHPNSDKVPALRFPGFEGEWEEKKLGDISQKISDGIHTTPIYSENGAYHFINGNNLVNGKIVLYDKTKKVEQSEFIKYKKELGGNTLLLSINGTIGSVAYYSSERVILGKSVCYINLRNNISKGLIFNFLQTHKVLTYFDSELTGTTIKNLSLNSIKNLVLFIPSFKEQQKIASFLSSVDERLQQLQQQQTLLEQYKNGCMQQLFSQKLRFKDEKGKTYKDWEEKKLAEIAEVNPKSFTLPETFVYIDLESVESGQLLKETIITKTGAPSRAQRLLKRNDILFQMVRPYQKNNLYFDLSGDYVASTGYAQIRTKQNTKFLYHILHTQQFVDRVLEKCTGTNYPAINSSDLSSLKVLIPSLEEQTKIANFLSAIDEQINSVKQQVAQTRQFKKGLLQQLFV